MATERKHKGLLLAPDDLIKGQLLAIHHWRNGRTWGLGIAHRLLAINLPYLVVQPLHDPKVGPLTLDIRKVRLMPVTPEFAEAQKNCQQPPEEDVPF